MASSPAVRARIIATAEEIANRLTAKGLTVVHRDWSVVIKGEYTQYNDISIFERHTPGFGVMGGSTALGEVQVTVGGYHHKKQFRDKKKGGFDFDAIVEHIVEDFRRAEREQRAFNEGQDRRDANEDFLAKLNEELPVAYPARFSTSHRDGKIKLEVADLTEEQARTLAETLRKIGFAK